jgi:hypothetical protein
MELALLIYIVGIMIFMQLMVKIARLSGLVGRKIHTKSR